VQTYGQNLPNCLRLEYNGAAGLAAPINNVHICLPCAMCTVYTWFGKSTIIVIAANKKIFY
jgi:hypothetical protein